MNKLNEREIPLVDIPEVNWRALRFKTTKNINQLIDTYGTDILYTIDESGFFPIHWAVVNGKVEIVEKMIETGVSPRIKASIYDEPEPIHLAALEGHIEMIDLLISREVDINIKDRIGCTPLTRAAMCGFNYKNKSSETVLHLISCGADVNQTDTNGLSCLHYAVLHGNKDTVHLLLNIGMDPNHQTNNGCRAIEFAVKTGNQYLMQLLGPLTNGITKSDLNLLIFRHKKKMMREKAIEVLTILARLNVMLAVVSAIFYAYPQYILYYLPQTSSDVSIHIILIVLNVFVFFSWYKISSADPGYLPLNSHNYENILTAKVKSGLSIQSGHKPQNDFDRSVRLCHMCKIIQNYRSNHCRFCRRCVASFDHHCIYLSTCIGQNNRLAFFSLGLSICLTGVLSCYMVTNLALAKDSLFTPYHWFNMCYTLLLALVGSILTVCNIRRAAINLTLNEELQSSKYSYLADSEGRFFNPFDRGSYFRNLIDYFTTKNYNYSKLNTCEC